MSENECKQSVGREVGNMPMNWGYIEEMPACGLASICVKTSPEVVGSNPAPATSYQSARFFLALFF